MKKARHLEKLVGTECISCLISWIHIIWHKKGRSVIGHGPVLYFQIASCHSSSLFQYLNHFMPCTCVHFKFWFWYLLFTNSSSPQAENIGTWPITPNTTGYNGFPATIFHSISSQLMDLIMVCMPGIEKGAFILLPGVLEFCSCSQGRSLLIMPLYRELTMAMDIFIKCIFAIYYIYHDWLHGLQVFLCTSRQNVWKAFH